MYLQTLNWGASALLLPDKENARQPKIVDP